MVPFSERLFMNRKIKAYQAIIYIVLFYLAAVLFLLGPGKLLEKDRLLAGAEIQSEPWRCGRISRFSRC